MTRSYLDASALSALGLGGAYQSWAATPTVGGLATDKPAPMDGNGKAASDSAAEVAVAEIYCDTAVSAVSGSILSIAGSTTGAIGAALTGSALATDIVAKINAGSNNVSTTVAPVTLTLANWCWARVKPGDTSRVQVFTRCAGSDLNFATTPLVAITQSGSWTTGFGGSDITQFSGGVDGPWAYLISPAAAFGKAVGAYGLLVAKSPTPTDPSGATDVLSVRCARGGGNISLTLALSAALSINPPVARYIEFDNGGDVWTGASGTLQLNITQSSISAVTTLASFGGVGGAGSLQIMRRTTVRDGLAVTYTAPNVNAYLGITGGTGVGTISSGNALVLNGVSFTEASATSIIQRTPIQYSWGVTDSCTFNFKTNHPLESLSAIGTVYLDSAITVNYSGIGANVPSIVNIVGNTASSNTCTRRIKKGKFNCGSWTVTTGLAYVTLTYVTNGAIFDFDVEGVSSPSFGFSFSQGVGPIGILNNGDTNRSFRLDNGLSVVDWIGNGSYPGLRSTAPTGINQCIKCTWPVAANSASPVYPVQFFAFNQQGDGLSIARIVTLELLAETTIAATKSDIGIIVHYTDATGATHNESTLLSPSLARAGIAAALAASSQTWSNVPTGYSEKSISLTTSSPVALNSEIAIQVIIAGTPSSASGFYFDLKPSVV